jgi:hypothetical protein
MADKGSIGIIKANAINRLTSAMQRLADAINALGNATGVEPIVLPQWRDPAYQEAMQLEAIADWLEKIADVYAPADEPLDEEITDAEADGMVVVQNADTGEIEVFDGVDEVEVAFSEPPPVEKIADHIGAIVTTYDPLTVVQLKEMADERGLDLSGVSRKADIIRVLVEDDLQVASKQANK